MRDEVLALLFMVIVGSLPAFFALAPKSGQDYALVRAPWVAFDAPMAVSRTIDGAILSVSDANGTVMMRLNARQMPWHVGLRHGVFVLRGNAPACGIRRQPNSPLNS